MSKQTWTVGVALGAVLSQSPAFPQGLVISEVFYDARGADGGREWVELFNPGPLTIDLSTWSLGYGGADFTYGTLALGGEIVPGDYFLIGGGDFDINVDFSPNLQNGGDTADGVALFDLPPADIDRASVPFFAVLYGGINANGLPVAGGLIPPAGVPGAPPGGSIELTGDGGWRVQPVPTPDTGPLVAAPTGDPDDAVTVPVPGTLALMVGGLASLVLGLRGCAGARCRTPRDGSGGFVTAQ